VALVGESHPELAQVSDLSLYMLSIDNLRKRKDVSDATMDMVAGTLEGMHWLCFLSHMASELQARTSTELVHSQKGTQVWITVQSPELLRSWLDRLDPSPLGAQDPIAVEDMLRSFLVLDCVASLSASIHMTPSFRDALNPRALLLADTLARLHATHANPCDYGVDVIMQTRLDRSDGQTCYDPTSQMSLDLLHVACSDADTLEKLKALCLNVAKVRNVEVRFVGELQLLPSHMHALCRNIESISCRRPDTKDPILRVRIAMAYDPIEDMRRQLQARTSTDIDLVVRTSGEQRASGFFPVETMYSEWFYLPMLFPDLCIADVVDTLGKFKQRHRRHGA
jgi:hypothetical protein